MYIRSAIPWINFPFFHFFRSRIILQFTRSFVAHVVYQDDGVRVLATLSHKFFLKNSLFMLWYTSDSVRFNFYQKKYNSIKFFFIKKQHQIKTSSNQPVLIQFDLIFLKQKPIWFGFFSLAWFFLFRFGFFPVWLSFFSFTRFFQFASIWLGFFSGWSSIRFFRFQACKTENKPVSFFKILIGLIVFFFTVWFFFFSFLNLIDFFVFFFLFISSVAWSED